MRNSNIILIAAAQAVILQGCTTEYKKPDITAYLEDSNIKAEVSDNYKSVDGGDGYTDRVWEAQDENGLNFHVIDDYHWGSETLTNNLKDDYEYQVLSSIKDELNTLGFSLASGENNTHASIEYRFQTDSDIDNAKESLAKLKQYIAQNFKQFDNSDVQFVLVYDSQYNSEFGLECSSIPYKAKNFQEDFLTNSEVAELLKESREYAVAIGDYDSPILSGITIDSIVDGSDNRLYDIQSENAEPLNLLMNNYRRVVHFGTLYNLIKDTGKADELNLNGTFDHFTFVGINGKTYEVQYSYNDMDLTSYGEKYTFNETDHGYFYVVDGIPTPTEYYFADWFNIQQIEDMTGIRVSNAPDSSNK